MPALFPKPEAHRQEAHVHLLHSANLAKKSGQGLRSLPPPGPIGPAEKGTVGWASQCAERRETQSLSLQPSAFARLAARVRSSSALVATQTPGQGVASILPSISCQKICRRDWVIR